MPSSITRTTNPVDWRKLDGIYINEQRPPAAIRGLSNDQVVCVGEFERGPVDVLTPITSSKQLVTTFGGYGPRADGTGYPGFVALLNKKFGRLWVIRLSNSSQATATVDLDESATDIIQVDAVSPGVWGNSLTVSVVDASDGVATHFNLEVKLNGNAVETFRNVDTEAGSGFSASDVVATGDYVKITYLAEGRPDNVADEALATGADGTFADADYTGGASDIRGLRLLRGNAASNIRFMFVAGDPSAAVKADLRAIALSEKTKVAIISGSSANTSSQAVTDAALYRSDRVFYAYPHVKTWVAEANGGQGALLDVAPASFLASLVAGVKPGENPAGAGLGRTHSDLLYGIQGLTKPDLARTDYEILREGGVAAFAYFSEIDRYALKSGVTSSLDPALVNIARRTGADYIQESVGRGLVTFQNIQMSKRNTDLVKAAIEGFLSVEQALGVIPTAEDINSILPPGSDRLAPFEVDIVNGNTAELVAQGIFNVILKVRLFAHMDFIVLTTEIGEGVEINLQEAV